MTTRTACLSCGGSGTREERHDFGTELLGCPDCEATGWRPIAGAAAAEDAERTAAPREPLFPAMFGLRGDEVYIVYRLGLDGSGIIAFGHAEDADAYAERYLCAADPEPVKVLDHADARRLIEQEEGDG